MNVYIDLFNSVMTEDLEALQRLVDSFPDFEVNSIVDEMGRSLLCGAIVKNNIKMIRYFIELGADLEHESVRGKCSLHWTNDVEVLSTIITFDANINKTDNNGETILTRAISKQNLPLIVKCLENGANIEGDFLECGSKPLVFPLIKAAATSESSQVIHLLTHGGANPQVTDEDGMSPLLLALQGAQDLKSIQHLIENGADIKHTNHRGENAFLYALKSRQRDIVEFFLELTFDENYLSQSGEFPLKCAAQNLTLGEMATRALVNRGAHVNLAASNDGVTPLHVAAFGGNTAVMAVLLENNANINAMTILGKTPLMLATEAGNINCTLLLLDNGANLSLRDKRNRTAVEYGNVEEILCILRNPNSRKRRRVVNVNKP